MALYWSSRVLTRPPEISTLVRGAAVIGLLLQAALWGNALLNFAVIHTSRRRLATDAASATMISMLGFLAKLVLWTIVVLVALDNVGVNVTALVAGLGIGGIAVALAAQNILGDLFASLSIVLDRPFVLGDSIAIDSFQGNVEHIGLKTTRLRSVSGEQLVFANSDLLKSRIRNYKRMTERRVQFNLSLSHRTPHEKLALVPAMLREIIEAQSEVRFDRAHFKALGDTSLVFEAVYTIPSPDYLQFMDIQQAINLAILERFQQQGIELAHPAPTVFPQRAGSVPEGKP
jgi:small-conductance mechanosensitive channel